MKLLLRFVLIVGIAGLVLAATVVALVPVGRDLSTAGHSTQSEVSLGPLDQRSYVYAADGSLLASLRAEIDREPVALAQVPAHVSAAILAVEDAEFYAHGGVNLRSILRALISNVDAGGVSQGGSTITQQLIKQEVLTDEQSLDRKLREAVLATRLEEQLTKDQILERYLNVVYFGNGAYGVQAASETYFGVGVESVDVPQAALLAALIANPARFDPIRYPDAARSRRDLALSRMVTTGAITAEDAVSYGSAPLPAQINQVLPQPDTYFVEQVKQELLDDPRLGATRADREYAIFRGGLRIHTTLDPRAQELALGARDDVLAEVSPEGTPAGLAPLPNPTSGELRDKGVREYTGGQRWATGTVISVEPATGAVRAMVGGPGFDQFKYNITTQRPGRQTGSAFKVFVLMAALENGLVPSDTINGGGPCTFKIPGVPEPYEVENFGNSGGGGGTITSQTLRSSNCAYVRLGQVVGLDKVVAQAQRMGVTAALDPGFFSLPLGSVEIRPIEMAGAYAAIANDGLYNAPYVVERVEASDGSVLFAHEANPVRAASPQSARLAAQILESNVRSGTGTRARIAGQHAAGKTGTAQDSSNGWFVGFTPYMSTAVWIGSPFDNYSVRIRGTGITGGSYPAIIWGRYMSAWHEGLEERSYPAPEGTRRGKALTVDRKIDISAPRPTTTTTPAATTPSTPAAPPTTQPTPPPAPPDDD
ncbi:MAG: transglycosylase domain-containing protein [Acidimicrobiia bacterium]